MKKITALILGVIAAAAGALLIFFGAAPLLGIPMIFKLRAPRAAATAISVIGGADGPTSIFLAGKVGGGSSAVLVILGAALLILAAVLLLKKRG